MDLPPKIAMIAAIGRVTTRNKSLIKNHPNANIRSKPWTMTTPRPTLPIVDHPFLRCPVTRNHFPDLPGTISNEMETLPEDPAERFLCMLVKEQCLFRPFGLIGADTHPQIGVHKWWVIIVREDNWSTTLRFRTLDGDETTFRSARSPYATLHLLSQHAHHLSDARE